VAAAAKPAVPVRGTLRRERCRTAATPFDIAACRRAFPDFRYTSLADGLNRAGGGQGRA